VICLGPSDSTKEIRTCLAMGAHKALHLVDDSDYRDAFSIASILADTIKGMDYDMIFFGKQGVDHDNSQVGLMVATILGIPAVSEITSFEMGEGSAVVKKELESGSSRML